MRHALFFCAFLTGTALRLLIPNLQRRRRRRRRRDRPPLPPLSSPVTSPTCPNATVSSLLDSISPPTPANRIASPPCHPTDCTFCLEPLNFTTSASLRRTPCGHFFHSTCLEKWIFHCADQCLDWTQYSLRDDGGVEMLVRPPICPNCTAVLPVLPEHMVKRVMLINVVRSLNLRDLATATEMYEAGIVFRVGATDRRISGGEEGMEGSVMGVREGTESEGNSWRGIGEASASGVGETVLRAGVSRSDRDEWERRTRVGRGGNVILEVHS